MGDMGFIWDGFFNKLIDDPYLVVLIGWFILLIYNIIRKNFFDILIVLFILLEIFYRVLVYYNFLERRTWIFYSFNNSYCCLVFFIWPFSFSTVHDREIWTKWRWKITWDIRPSFGKLNELHQNGIVFSMPFRFFGMPSQSGGRVRRSVRFGDESVEVA